MGLFAFTSCGDDEGDNPNPGEIIEDGIYVTGAAAGSETLTSDYLMGAGFNEAKENASRAGMYEKYLALEGGKEFSLLLYKAGEKTNYGATLAEDSLKGEGDQPNIAVWKGNLVTGENAPAMTVKESGLYHIVLDLNEADDLSSAMIVIAPVEWGVRGAMNSWGFNTLTAPTFNNKTMTYTWSGDVSNSGDFKFAYGNGWKIQLDQAGEVKANTNLGNDAEEDGKEYTKLKPGGKNIAIGKGTYTISLTWTLKGGAIVNSYEAKIEKTADLPNTDYSDYSMGLIGNAIWQADKNDWNNWDVDVLPSKPAVDGDIYTWTYDNVKIRAKGDGNSFKFRKDATWDLTVGFNNVTMAGSLKDDFVSGSDDGNFAVNAEKSYKLILEVNADGDLWTLSAEPAE